MSLGRVSGMSLGKSVRDVFGSTVPSVTRTPRCAVAAASPGDTNIILKQSTHLVISPMGIDLQGKAIRITSSDPNDPNVVANTIIDCAGDRLMPRRAFWFHSGETSETIVTGVTIRNGFWVGNAGLTGGGTPTLPLDPNDFNVGFIMASGEDVNGVGYGGAILCENASSPLIRNCIIEDCTVAGAAGGDIGAIGNRRTGLGREKIFEVRSLYNDVTFIDEYLTEDFVLDQKMYAFGYNERNDRWEIESRTFQDVKQQLLTSLTNAGNPIISVIDANHGNRSELLLEHTHQGADLRLDWAKEVAKALARVWTRPVEIHTVVDEKPTALRFDGKDYSQKAL